MSPTAGDAVQGRLPRPGPVFGLACLLAGLSVALAAMAAHAAGPQQVVRLQSAASQGLMHAVAVIALLRWATGRARWLVVTLLSGAWLFVIALVLAPFWPGATRFAPWGGSAMILSWLALAGWAVWPRAERRNAAL